MANLSVTQWAEIRARYEQGEPVNEIAPDYGIKHKTIYTKACRQICKFNSSVVFSHIGDLYVSSDEKKMILKGGALLLPFL